MSKLSKKQIDVIITCLEIEFKDRFSGNILELAKRCVLRGVQNAEKQLGEKKEDGKN